MCVELPRRSLVAYAVQQNYVPLSSYNIETQLCGPSILEVNHVKSERYVSDSCDCICLLYLSFIT